MTGDTRINVGARVQIRDIPIDGHYRAPFYIRNQTGIVERYCGSFPNPERLAYGEDGLPVLALYRVRFSQRDLWPDYAGSAKDTLEIEVYEHWLASSDSIEEHEPS